MSGSDFLVLEFMLHSRTLQFMSLGYGIHMATSM
jgi:hypothetical protein